MSAFLNMKKIEKILPIAFLILGLIIFGILFYTFQDFNSMKIDQTLFEKIGEKASSVGVIVMFVALILLFLMVSNVPLIIINFKKLTISSKLLFNATSLRTYNSKNFSLKESVT